MASPEDKAVPDKGAVSTQSEEQPTATQPTSRLSLEQSLQILRTFIVFFNTWGILLTFGAFQTYYQTHLLAHTSSSKISWLSTTSAFLLQSAGIVTGALYDRGYHRSLLVCGALVHMLGVAMISLCSAYYEFFLAQALCVGLGAGAIYSPSIAAAAAGFGDVRVRSRVMGVLACGSSIGGIVYPVIFSSLLDRIGFAWTVRAIALIMLVLYCVAFLSLFFAPTAAVANSSERQRQSQVRPLFDVSIFTDLPWLSLSLASVFGAMAYYFLVLYLPLVTQAQTPQMKLELVLDLPAILNGASGVGRLLGGVVAAKLGPTETTFLSLLASSVLLYCWTAVRSVAATIVWTVLSGMVTGVFVALIGAFVPLFTPSMAVLGTRSGIFWACIGVGMLVGSPIGGAIFELSEGEGDWRVGVYSGTCMLVAALLFIYPILHLRRRKRGGQR